VPCLLHCAVLCHCVPCCGVLCCACRVQHLQHHNSRSRGPSPPNPTQILRPDIPLAPDPPAARTAAAAGTRTAVRPSPAAAGVPRQRQQPQRQQGAAATAAVAAVQQGAAAAGAHLLCHHSGFEARCACVLRLRIGVLLGCCRPVDSWLLTSQKHSCLFCVILPVLCVTVVFWLYLYWQREQQLARMMVDDATLTTLTVFDISTSLLHCNTVTYLPCCRCFGGAGGN
jgi:hypothetical protein